MTDRNPRARATGACAPCHALPARALAALLLAGGIAGVHAQSWPAKPVRLVVSFAPGGANDILGRAIAQQLTEQFGQQVVVENRAGAGGAVGTEFVAKAPPDGYTLLLGTSSAFAIIPHLSKPNYDAQKDFAPIAPFATLNYVILAHPSVPVKTVKELVAFAKARPGQLGWATAGVGGTGHLAGEYFSSLVGIKLNHVPYKSNPAAAIDVI
ncbi:MAG: Bug family tripartite tricarboxylate transporter substrate binding protein, partial [bacterium]